MTSFVLAASKQLRRFILTLLLFSMLLPAPALASEPTPPGSPLPFQDGSAQGGDPRIDLAQLPPLPRQPDGLPHPLDPDRKAQGRIFLQSLTAAQRSQVRELLAENPPPALPDPRPGILPSAPVHGTPPFSQDDQAGLRAWISAADAGLQAILSPQQLQQYRASLLPEPQALEAVSGSSKTDCANANYYHYYGVLYGYYFYKNAYVLSAANADPYAYLVYDMAYNGYLYGYYAYLYAYYAYYYHYDDDFIYYAYYFSRHALGFANYGSNLADVQYTWLPYNAYAKYTSIYGYLVHQYTSTADNYIGSCTNPWIDEEFENGYPNWKIHSGSWTSDGTYLKTEGLPGSSSTISFDANFQALDFSAALYRTGSGGGNNWIAVRGTPDPLNSGYDWSNDYEINYTRAGYYAIYKMTGGEYYLLRDWTYSSAINQGDNWNTLRITASGDYLEFYINDTLLYYVYDSAFTSGRVGIGMSRHTDTTGDALFVDWAYLTAPSSLAAGPAAAPSPAASRLMPDKSQPALPSLFPSAGSGKMTFLPVVSRGPGLAAWEPGVRAIAGSNQAGLLPPAGFDPTKAILEPVSIPLSIQSALQDAAPGAPAWVDTLSSQQAAAFVRLLRDTPLPGMNGMRLSPQERSGSGAERPPLDAPVIETLKEQGAAWQQNIEHGMKSILDAEQFQLYQASLLPALSQQPGALAPGSACSSAAYYDYYAYLYAYYHYLEAYYAYAAYGKSEPYLLDVYLFGYYDYLYAYYASIYSYYASSDPAKYGYYAYYFTRHALGFASWGYAFAYTSYTWTGDDYTYYAYENGYYASTYLEAGDPEAVNCYRSDVKLGVATMKQEQGNWCWIATSQGILDYLGTEVSQCEIANYALESIVCCIPGLVDLYCDQLGSMYGKRKSVGGILEHWGVAGQGQEPPLSFAALSAQIDLGRPMAIGWLWKPGLDSGHALTIYGYNSAITNVYYIDPGYGDARTSAYDAFVEDNAHIWKYTYFNIHQ